MYLGLGYKFGLRRIRNVAIMRSKSVGSMILFLIWIQSWTTYRKTGRAYPLYWVKSTILPVAIIVNLKTYNLEKLCIGKETMNLSCLNRFLQLSRISKIRKSVIFQQRSIRYSYIWRYLKCDSIKIFMSVCMYIKYIFNHEGKCR